MGIFDFLFSKKLTPEEIKHCEEMRKLCLEILNEFSLLKAQYPTIGETVYRIAAMYIENLKLKDLKPLNKNSVRGYIYNTLYTIPMRALPKFKKDIPGMTATWANLEAAGFCIECVNYWHEEFPFVPDEKIKEMKQKARKKYGVSDNFLENYEKQ